MAADFLAFAEGETYLLTAGQGLPSTSFFLLSTNAVGSFTVGTTLAGGVAEVTGTGYARKSQATPVPVGGSVVFVSMAWNTGGAVDWPIAVRSCLLVTSADNSGKAVCVWNLQPGGAPRNMSAQGQVEQFAPTLATSS